MVSMEDVTRSIEQLKVHVEEMLMLSKENRTEELASMIQAWKLANEVVEGEIEKLSPESLRMVADLPFGTRMKNITRRRYFCEPEIVRSVADLLKVPFMYLTRTPNFGPITFKELIDVLISENFLPSDVSAEEMMRHWGSKRIFLEIALESRKGEGFA